MSKPLAVVPTYLRTSKDLEVVLACLESLRRTSDCDALVVDDGSPAPELVDEMEAASSGLEVEVLRAPTNEGFSRAVNIGLRRALNSGQDAVLVNADIEFVDEGWLERMAAQQRRDGQGPASVVGALLLYPSGLIQHAGIFFSLLHRCFDHRYRYAPGNLPEAQAAERCPVTGALQFIRHDALKIVGLYDEGFLMGFEDVDYCLRTFESGGDCVYQPTVRAYHHESLFRGRPSPKIEDWQSRSWIYFTSKWGTTSFAEWVPTL